MEILHVYDLVKKYSGRTVVNQVEFQVNQGEIVGLLGPNGAGKTTSFKIAMGMIASDDGRVIFNGEDVTGLPMYRRARLGMGYLSQEPSVFQRLTVEQNLLAILETLQDLTREQRLGEVNRLLAYFHLTHLRKQVANTLSGGERRRLEIARSLITNPKLILLDEPFSGVDPKVVEELQGHIMRLRDEHDIGILLTDHNVHQTLAVTDRSYILHEGKVLCSGTSRELINNPDVRREYLANTFRGDEFDERVPAALGAEPPAPVKTEVGPPPAPAVQEEEEILVPPPTPKRRSPKLRTPQETAAEPPATIGAVDEKEQIAETVEAVRAEAEAAPEPTPAAPAANGKTARTKTTRKKTTRGKSATKKTARRKSAPKTDAPGPPAPPAAEAGGPKPADKP